jgi:hypothetical protein
MQGLKPETLTTADESAWLARAKALLCQRRGCTGLLQDREEAGNPVWGTGKQGAASPLTEREAGSLGNFLGSPPPFSLSPKAAK